MSLFLSEEDGEHQKKKIWYFSIQVQLEELMERLDKEYWEMDLYTTLEEMKEEVHTHMAVTEELTNKARGTNTAYLTALKGRVSVFQGCTIYSRGHQRGAGGGALGSPRGLPKVVVFLCFLNHTVSDV